MSVYLTATNTHGTYTAYSPDVVDEFGAVFFAMKDESLRMDALRMFTANITSVDNWWNGESATEMFIALADCGASAALFARYAADHVFNGHESSFEAKVHSYKVDHLNFLCADLRCMAHRSASIYTEAYAMNTEYNELTQSAANVRATIDYAVNRLERHYATMNDIKRELSAITGR